MSSWRKSPKLPCASMCSTWRVNASHGQSLSGSWSNGRRSIPASVPTSASRHANAPFPPMNLSARSTLCSLLPLTQRDYPDGGASAGRWPLAPRLLPARWAQMSTPGNPPCLESLNRRSSQCRWKMTSPSSATLGSRARQRQSQVGILRRAPRASVAARCPLYATGGSSSYG